MSLGRRASRRLSSALIDEYKITPDERTALIKKYEDTQERFIVKIRKDPVYRLKFFQTFWIWWSFLVFVSTLCRQAMQHTLSKSATYASFESKIRLYKIHACKNQPRHCRGSAGHSI